MALHADDSSIFFPPLSCFFHGVVKRVVFSTLEGFSVRELNQVDTEPISTGSCLFGLWRVLRPQLCLLTGLLRLIPPLCHADCLHVFNISTFLSVFFSFFPVPIIKTEPNDEYDSLGTARLSMHSKPYYSQPRLTPIIPIADPDACLVGAYPPCLPRHVTIPSTPPSSSPTLQDLSPVAYSKCLPNSPSHAAPPGSVMPHIQESPSCPNLAHPASPDHSSSLGMLQGSPNHLNSPGPHGYHPVYANSSPSTSPLSHPSTPGGTAESPLVQAYSPTQVQAAANSKSLLAEDTSPSSMAITVKQEPQELDQMYLDDGE